MKHMPVSFKICSDCSTVSFKFTPRFSSTSAAPLLLETLRFPCFATGTPPVATTNALVVEMLKVPASSPPVPTISITAKSGSSLSPFSLMTVAHAVISSMVSPFIRSPVKNAAICAGVVSPLMISFITSFAASKLKSCPSITS